MSKGLEKIVASLELCKLIPAGEFEDTALVWETYYSKYSIKPVVIDRKTSESTPHEFVENVYPAPTLSEILGKIPDCAEVIRMKEHNHCMRATGLPHVHDSSLANCAIRLWLKLKGVELK